MLLRRSFAYTLILALLSGVVACGEPQRFSALPGGATVLAFGDSITFGVGAAKQSSYPKQLAASTGWRVVNAGISGDTAREARTRLAALLTQHQPDLVIVELGGNDFLRQQRPAQVKGFLQTVVREAKASGAIVVLVAVPRLSMLRATVGALEDADLYAQLAEEEQLILVPDVLSDILSDEALRADAIHPNADGYAELTQGILAVLGSVGLLGSG
ncbi:MAG: GDSL-type esterase/lipase family protein [Halioglobus sp.]